MALGNLLSLWHEYREAGLDNPKNAKIPSKEELEANNRSHSAKLRVARKIHK